MSLGAQLVTKGHGSLWAWMNCARFSLRPKACKIDFWFIFTWESLVACECPWSMRDLLIYSRKGKQETQGYVGCRRDMTKLSFRASWTTDLRKTPGDLVTWTPRGLVTWTPWLVEYLWPRPFRALLGSHHTHQLFLRIFLYFVLHNFLHLVACESNTTV